jgi:hypothetical protein
LRTLYDGLFAGTGRADASDFKESARFHQKFFTVRNLSLQGDSRLTPGYAGNTFLVNPPFREIRTIKKFLMNLPAGSGTRICPGQ